MAALVGPRVTPLVGGDTGTPISTYQGSLGRTATGTLTLSGKLGTVAPPATSGAMVGPTVTAYIGGNTADAGTPSYLGQVRTSASGTLTLSGTARYNAGASATAPTLRFAQPLNYQATDLISTLAVTIPATAQTGDVVIVALVTNQPGATVVAPEGWMALAGVDRDNAIPLASYTFGRTVTAADPGTTQTFNLGTASRLAGVLGVFAGATLDNYLPASKTDSSGQSSPTLPTLTGIEPNSLVLGIANRRLSQTVPADLTEPAGWEAGPEGKTAFVSSPNYTSFFFHKVASPSGDGTAGGDVYTSSPASIGATYLVALPPTTEVIAPPAQANGNIARTSTGTVALAQAKIATGGPLSPSGEGTLALSGRVGARGSIALTAEGTATLTAGKTGYVGSIALSATGTVGLTRRVAIRGAFAPSGVGTLSLFGTPASDTAKGGALVQTATGTVDLRASRVTARGALAPNAVGTLVLVGKPAVSGSLSTSATGSLTWAVTIRNAGSLATTASGSLTLSGLAKVARSGTIIRRGLTDLVLTGRGRNTAFFYRALRPIYLGPGAAFARGYNINEVVPNAVVFAHDLTDEVYLTNN